MPLHTLPAFGGTPLRGVMPFALNSAARRKPPAAFASRQSSRVRRKPSPLPSFSPLCGEKSLSAAKGMRGSTYANLHQLMPQASRLCLLLLPAFGGTPLRGVMPFAINRAERRKPPAYTSSWHSRPGCAYSSYLPLVARVSDACLPSCPLPH